MNRFRKKSESRRQFNPAIEGVRTTTTVHDDALPSLPPASDFRTSLILPGLTRRFTLLRSYNGDPVALEDLRTRFAEQRARGAVNQVSTEEEGIILEALGFMRSSSARDDSLLSDSASPRDSTTHSIDTANGSLLSHSPSKSTKRSNSARRYSNNLFGSGRFRDYSYVRSAQRGGSRSALSFTPSDSSMSARDGHFRPTTPDREFPVPLFVPSSPSEGHERTSTTMSSTYASDANSSTGTDFRLSSTFSQDAFNRTSRALEDVIREIEEEADEPGLDDDIVLLRSPSAAVDHVSEVVSCADTSDKEARLKEARGPLTDYETGTALSSDDQVENSRRASTMSVAAYSGSRTTSPTPRLPGYIPGMQRPMTPRDAAFESDDQSSSATPKATSPRLPGMSGSVITPCSSAIGRRDSNASTAKQLSRTNTPLASAGSTTPLFFSRTVNGRFTPEDRQNGDAMESDRERYGARRKPTSPLTGQAYQARGVASPSPVPSSSSRPGTPSSNYAWPHAQNQFPHARPSHARSESGHSRNGSIISLTDITSTDLHSYGVILDSSLERPKSSTTTRSVRSPVLPDSPLFDHGRIGQGSQGKPSLEHHRTPSVISGVDLGSPFSPSKVMTSTPNNTSSSVRRAKSPTVVDAGKDRARLSNGTTGSGSPKPLSKRHQKAESASSMAGFSLSLGASSLPLILSPMMNSSRSSMESEGSSYHSWDDDAKGRLKDRVKTMFAKIDAEPPAWYDLGADDKLSSYGKEEELVRQLSGLSKAEFAQIQDKLIELVTNKSFEGGGRERSDRAGSALRKRRPSTSQSNYSAGGGRDSRVNTPSPPGPNISSSPSTVVALATPAVDERQSNSMASKANALLDSVISSIQSPGTTAPVGPVSKEDEIPAVTPRERTASEVSSPTRRNRNLANALFGPEDEAEVSQLPLPLSPITPLSVPYSPARDRSHPDNMSSPQLVRSPDTLSASGLLSVRQMSSPNLPNHHDHELTLEVQRKVEAATIALRKSPSNPKFPDTSTFSKRKINRDQISSPTLVSSTTSVDTIPLPSTSPGSNSGSSFRFGQRIKKLRGTLRSKTNPLLSAEEVTPYPLDLRSSTNSYASQVPLSQTGTVNSVSPASGAAQAAGTIDNEKLKIQVTPATSSGPGLKGFMARFRRNKYPDTPLDVPQRNVPYTSGSTTSFLPLSPEGLPSQVHSSPVTRKPFHGQRSASMRTMKQPQQPLEESQHHVSQSVSIPNTLMAPPGDEDYPQDSQRSEAALRQLFDAASDLGLDHAALNSLVARSTSTSSQSTRWTRMTNNSVAPSRKSRPPDVLEDTQESLRSQSPGEGRSSLEDFSARVVGPAIRKLSIKKNIEPTLLSLKEQEDPPPRVRTTIPGPSHLRPHVPARDEKNASASRNTIIRRTIILPSETKGIPIDIGAILRKNPQAMPAGPRKRRSASGASIHSNRSLQDRAPTPPPPRTGANGKRFSTDAASPPVPQLPHSFTTTLDVTHNGEKPSSPYDSLFEMYGGDSRVASAMAGDGHSDVEGMGPSESGPALEVVELANGETIWSIVNGLRDDDGESVYGSRASFASEYSLREANNENVQVYFKEHARTSSKDSANSIISKKRPGNHGNNINRPETKVFFSSSTQIGRLIENLSKKSDAGSFNIVPRPQSHATTPSMGSETDMRWTVEERLEQMLGAMGST